MRSTTSSFRSFLITARALYMTSYDLASTYANRILTYALFGNDRMEPLMLRKTVLDAHASRCLGVRTHIRETLAKSMMMRAATRGCDAVRRWRIDSALRLENGEKGSDDDEVGGGNNEDSSLLFVVLDFTFRGHALTAIIKTDRAKASELGLLGEETVPADQARRISAAVSASWRSTFSVLFGRSVTDTIGRASCSFSSSFCHNVTSMPLRLCDAVAVLCAIGVLPPGYMFRTLVEQRPDVAPAYEAVCLDDCSDYAFPICGRPVLFNDSQHAVTAKLD